MNKLFLTVFLVCAILLCGCADNAPKETIPTELPTISETEPLTEPPTEAPTEPPTEPIVYLDIESGSYLEKFTDPDTASYLDYYIHIPNNATADMPLLVFLHGDGEVAKPWALENYGPIAAAREIYGEEFPFIAVFPCTRMQSWTYGNIPNTLMGLIEYIADEYQIDRNQIMLTGHSRGSMGVWHMISMYGSYFSCAVPISCGPEYTMDYEMASQVTIRAVVGMVGELEGNYGRAMQRTIDAIIEAGGTAEIIILEDLAHEQTSTATYTEEMFEWMLAQKKENSQ